MGIIDIVRKTCVRFREQLLYLVFGALTTVVSIASYGIAVYAFSMGVLLANVVSWVLAVVFAFATNRKWVFESNTHGRAEVLREIASFFGSRLLTLGLEELIILVGVSLLGGNAMVVKVVGQVAVIVANYLLSKFLVFRN